MCKCGTLCLTSANRPLICRKIALGGTARGVHLLLLLSEGHICAIGRKDVTRAKSSMAVVVVLCCLVDMAALRTCVWASLASRCWGEALNLKQV